MFWIAETWPYVTLVNPSVWIPTHMLLKYEVLPFPTLSTHCVWEAAQCEFVKSLCALEGLGFYADPRPARRTHPASTPLNSTSLLLEKPNLTLPSPIHQYEPPPIPWFRVLPFLHPSQFPPLLGDRQASEVWGAPFFLFRGKFSASSNFLKRKVMKISVKMRIPDSEADPQHCFSPCVVCDRYTSGTQMAAQDRVLVGPLAAYMSTGGRGL